MKKICTKSTIVLTIALAIITTITSCDRRNKTVIASNDGTTSQRIEYAGKMVFNKDKTGLDFMSKTAYFKFERDGRDIEAERDMNGKIKYRYNGGRETDDLDQEGKQFLAVAVNEIAREQAKLKASRQK